MLARHIAIARVAGAMAVCFLVLDLAFGLVWPESPRFIWETQLLPRPERHDAGARLAAAGGDLEGRELAVIAGLSSVRDGVDPTVIDEHDPGPRRWLLIGAGGIGFRYLRYLTRPMFVADPPPAVIVLGLHPEWLQVPPIREKADPDEEPEPITGADHLWVWRERNAVRAALRLWLDAGREHALAGAGVELASIYPPAGDPWAPQFKDRNEDKDAELGEFQLGVWERRGWLDPERFRTDTVEADHLRDLLHDCNATGAEVFVVLMPANEPWRERAPANAVPVLREVLTEHIPADRIIDLRALLPSELFFDNSHANAEGRMLLSKAIAERVAAGMAE